MNSGRGYFFMKEFSNLGDQIKNTVQDAVDTMNFDQLNKNITDSVNSALDEVRSHLNINSFSNSGSNQKIRDWKVTYGSSQNNQQNSNQSNTQYHQTNTQYRQNNQSTNMYQGQSNAQATADMWEQRKKAAIERGKQMRREWANREKTVVYHNSTVANKTTQLVPSVKNIPGRVLGPILKGTGYTFATMTAIGGLTTGFIYYMNGSSGCLLAAEILGGVFLANALLARSGSRISGRAKRFKQYIMYIGERKFCQIEALAAHTGFSKRSVVKDIRRMLQMGLFPQGHLDEQGTCLILDDETYQQYLITSSEFERKKREEAELLKQEKKQAKKTDSPENAELRKTINEGRSYIRQINEANAAIPAVDISEKLSRLEQITSKIFSFVEQHPEQLPELRKFMEYYLPITLKLVNAYKELDAQPIQGDNILSSKKEIVKTLDTINMAFENLLDSLYESTAMDVSSDISVLEAMFAQDGLTKKDFDLK